MFRANVSCPDPTQAEESAARNEGKMYPSVTFQRWLASAVDNKPNSTVDDKVI